jgi:hypothetical protein
MRIFASPAILMSILAAIYVVVRVPEGHRSRVLALLVMTIVGVVEILGAVTRLVRQDPPMLIAAARAVSGVGALLVGYALLGGTVTFVPFVAGALLLTTGMLMYQRLFSRPAA